MKRHNRKWFVCILLLLSAPARADEAYRVAIFHDPSLPVEGCATPVETFEKALAQDGITPVRLNADQLADAQALNAEAFDLLVIPTGGSFPVAAKPALLAFLQHGGDLLSTGGYAFDRLWTKREGKWVPVEEQWTQEKARARDPHCSLVPNGGFEQDAEGWAGTSATACSISHEGALSGSSCGQVSNTTSTAGAAWEKPLSVEPGKSYLVGAAAKTDKIQGPGFAFLAVYQYDAQGGIVHFIDFVHLHDVTEWKRYETQVDVAPQAAKVVLRGGLHIATGTIWLDDATCAPVPKEERINGHFGKPEDGLILDPFQLTIFSPDQLIAGDALCASPESPLPIDWQTPGPAQGYEATAQLGSNARWIPLIEARDRWNRSSGAAGALVHHFGDPFPRSSWAIFGVTNRDVFEGEPGLRLIREVVRRLRVGVLVQALQTDSPIYSRGEVAHVKIEVCNATKFPRSVQVNLDFNSVPRDAEQALLHSEARPIDLPPQSTQTLDISWPVDTNAPDFVRLSASAKIEAIVLDRASAGFCVRDDATIAQGTRLRYANNGYVLEGRKGTSRPACLFGTDTYCNMFLSRNQSPWTWFLDMQAMRDYGLHMFENLQFTPAKYQYSDAEWRQLDAFVQLAQRFDLPYMAGLLIGQDVAVEDAELQQQAEMCRQFAARYKQVPGLIYYLNGDFQLRMKDLPDLRRLWNQFLRDLYHTDGALRAAWAGSPPEAALGDLPLKDAPPQSWYDARARDLKAFKCELMRRWTRALCQAIRKEDSGHPITSEYYQRPYDGIDLRLTVEDLDTANFGYFDRPQRDVACLMATIKWNDMRRAGKSVNIGEFGVKTHDAWSAGRGATEYHVARTETEQEHLFWWVAHAAWALGVTKIQNWCWSDDPDRVFPWGLAWNHPLRAKPVLKLYRNLRLVADRLVPTYAPAEAVLIMPDTWRLGATEDLSHSLLMNALECLLATNVPFDVCNESQLMQLAQTPPRLAVMPAAYALSDETIAALQSVAENGTCVYLSGDPSITPTGQRQSARLESLFGVRFQSESPHPSSLPVPTVTPIDAKPVENPCTLSLFQRPRGKGPLKQGAFIWSPEPWETFPGLDLFVKDAVLTTIPARNFYLTLVGLAHLAPPAQIQADRGVWRATTTASGPNRLVSIFPRSALTESTAVHVRFADANLQFDAGLPVPAAVLLDPQNNALLATGSRGLSVNAKRLVEGDGAWIAISLDGRPLTDTDRLAVSSTAAGHLSWTSSARELTACAAEWQQGKVRSVASVPLHQTSDGWQIETQSNELYLVAPAQTISADGIAQIPGMSH